MTTTSKSRFRDYELALAAFKVREYEKAANICRGAAVALEKNECFDDAAVAYDLLGTANYRLGLAAEAKSCYLKSLELSELAGSTPSREYTKTLNSLAAAANALGEHAEAVNWLGKALSLNERHQAREETVSTFHQLGVVESSRQNLEEARRWFRKAIAAADAKYDIERIVASVRWLASTMTDQYDPEEVDRVYAIATDAMEAAGGVVHAQNAAEQARREFDFRASTEFYRKAFEMASRRGQENVSGTSGTA